MNQPTKGVARTAETKRKTRSKATTSAKGSKITSPILTTTSSTRLETPADEAPVISLQKGPDSGRSAGNAPTQSITTRPVRSTADPHILVTKGINRRFQEDISDATQAKRSDKAEQERRKELAAAEKAEKLKTQNEKLRGLMAKKQQQVLQEAAGESDEGESEEQNEGMEVDENEERPQVCRVS